MELQHRSPCPRPSTWLLVTVIAGVCNCLSMCDVISEETRSGIHAHKHDSLFMHAGILRRDSASVSRSTCSWWDTTAPRVCCGRRRALLARQQHRGTHVESGQGEQMALWVCPGEFCNDHPDGRSCSGACRACIAGGPWCTEPIPHATEMVAELSRRVQSSAELFDALDLHDRFLLRASLLLAQDTSKNDFAGSLRLYTAARRALDSLDKRRESKRTTAAMDMDVLNVGIDSVLYGTAVAVRGSMPWPDELVLSLTVENPAFPHRAAGTVVLLRTLAGADGDCIMTVADDIARLAAVGASAVLVWGGPCATHDVKSKNAVTPELDFALPVAAFRESIGVHITTAVLRRPTSGATVSITRQSAAHADMDVERENTRLTLYRGLLDSQRALEIASGTATTKAANAKTESDACNAIASSLPAIMPDLLGKTDAARLWQNPRDLLVAHGEVPVEVVRTSTLLHHHVQPVRVRDEYELTPWVVELDGVVMGTAHPLGDCPLWPADMNTTMYPFDPHGLLMLGGAIALFETRQGDAAANLRGMFKAASDVSAVGGRGMLCYGPGCSITATTTTEHATGNTAVDLPTCTVPVAVFQPHVGVLLSTMLRRHGGQGGRVRVHRPDSITGTNSTTSTVMTLREMVRDVLEVDVAGTVPSEEALDGAGLASTPAMATASYMTLSRGHPLSLSVQPSKLAELFLHDPAHTFGAVDLIVCPRGSGLALHSHEHQVVWHWLASGEKRWLLVNTGAVKGAIQEDVWQVTDGNNTSFSSGFHRAAALTRRLYPNVIELTQMPGEALIIPPGWGHAVLNTKPSVAYSAQLGELPSTVLTSSHMPSF